MVSCIRTVSGGYKGREEENRDRRDFHISTTASTSKSLTTGSGLSGGESVEQGKMRVNVHYTVSDGQSHI